MRETRASRRSVLSTVATVGAVGVAGCLGGDQTYEFSTRPIGADLAAVTDRYYSEDLAEKRAQYAIDYPYEYKRSVIDRLIEEGSVEVPQLQLSSNHSFGTTTRPRPQFVSADGSYFLIVEDDRTEFTDTQWSFYLDLTDEEPPSSATVVTSPPSSLSETDREVVGKAMEAVGASRSDPIDASDHAFPHRGVRLHDQFDRGASDLVPSPPFEYLKRNGTYFAANAEEGELTLTRYRFSAREVATTERGLREFFAAEFVDARFEASGLSQDAVNVLDTATAGRSGREYSETGSMSEGLATVTERLGMREHLPDGITSRVALNGTIFRYDGRWYDGDLSVQ